VKQLHGLRGTSVGAYELSDCLGHGSWTAVYRASVGNDEHAVKLVDSRLGGNAEFVARISREATILDKIGHHGILPIEDAVSAHGLAAAAMPLKRATTLHELMVQRRVNEDFAWSALSQIAESLHLAHQRGLVYRVLKPGNVLVDPDGIVYLAEFGMTGSRIGQLALATPDVQVGGPQYLAPEQVMGRLVDHRADIYAFGVLAFELATGTRLHRGTLTDILRATLRGAPPSASARNPSVPPAVDPVLRRALAGHAGRRYQSVWDLVEDLVAPPEANAPAAAALDAGLDPAALPGLAVPEMASSQQNILDSYFATCLRAAREAAGPQWPRLAPLVGLERYVVEDPSERMTYVPALLALSRLANAFEAVFAADAPHRLDEWGSLVGRSWLQSIQRKPSWIAGPPTSRLVDMLSVFLESLNRSRGEELHGWKQVNRSTFRVTHEWNMTAVGRRRPAEACHFWTGAYRAALRWAGLEEDWRVAEVECGCVTGTYVCVFNLVRVDR
jgi:serine/threonine protein kinase